MNDLKPALQLLLFGVRRFGAWPRSNDVETRSPVELRPQGLRAYVERLKMKDVKLIRSGAALVSPWGRASEGFVLPVSCLRGVCSGVAQW